MTRRIREVYAEVLNGGSQEALRAQKSVDR
jgi:hypothetical protein